MPSGRKDFGALATFSAGCEGTMGRLSGRELGEQFVACGDRLALYARQWLDADAARDVVGAVFLRLAQQSSPPRNIRAWLYRCVRNAAMNELRSRRTRQSHATAVGDNRQAWFEPHLDDTLDAAAAQQAMESLPEHQREVVLLRIWGQMTLAEIGEVLDESVSTIHSRYTAALDAIRRRMTTHARTQHP
jgi:RNA polymerase sigma factor (sigma-70 family)